MYGVAIVTTRHGQGAITWAVSTDFERQLNAIHVRMSREAGFRRLRARDYDADV
jgi:hypothetical protein